MFIIAAKPHSLLGGLFGNQWEVCFTNTEPEQFCWIKSQNLICNRLV